MARTCPLCGAAMEPYELDPKRKQKLQDNDPDLGDFSAFVCSACGHVSYRKE